MKKKIIGYSIGPIATAGLGFITLPILTWSYSIVDIGRISMLQVVSSFSVLLFCLGLDQAYVREYHESNDRPRLLKQTLLPGMILLFFSLASLYFYNPSKLSYLLYGISSPFLSLLSILCFFLTFISRFLSLIIRMEDRSFAFSMSQVLPKVMFLIFIGFTLLLGFPADINNLVAAHTLSIVAAFIIFSWNTKREWLASLKKTIDRKQQKLLLSFGFPLVIGGLASWGLNVMDKLFLRKMSTFNELGIYSVTMSVAGATAIFASIFNTIWSPMVYKWIHEGVDVRRIDEISEHLLAAVYFLVVLSGIFSWLVPIVLPAQYASIQFLLTLCLLGPLFYTLSETTAIGITIARKTKYSMFVSVCAMMLNAVGNFILVPRHGALGAAISTAVSFWLFYILRTEFSRRVWRKTPRFKAYLVTITLLSITIASSVALRGSLQYSIVWLVLFFLGLCVFIDSVKMLFIKVENLVLGFLKRV